MGINIGGSGLLIPVLSITSTAAAVTVLNTLTPELLSDRLQALGQSLASRYADFSSTFMTQTLKKTEGCSSPEAKGLGFPKHVGPLHTQIPEKDYRISQG